MRSIKAAGTASIAGLMLLLLAFLFPIGAHAADPLNNHESLLTVGNGVEAAFQSINQAAAAADAGDTILVKPGIYRERVILNKTVTLLAEGSAVIDGGANGSVLTITADGCRVEGFTIRGSGSDLKNNDAGMMIKSRNNYVINNLIEENIFGIYLFGSSGNKVLRNTIVGKNNLDESLRGNGIHLWNADENLIEGNTIHGARDGLYFSYADSNIIKDNVAYGQRFGVHYMYSSDNLLQKNSLRNNKVGAMMMFSQNNIIEGNILIGNSDYGIVLKDFDENTIRNNKLKDNGTGVYLPNAVNNKIYGNMFEANVIGLHLTGGTEKNVFSKNAFINNENQVRIQGNTNNTWSEAGRGNYWSDYRGFDLDGDGIGDLSYRETDLVQSLLAEHPTAKLLYYAPVMQLLNWLDNSFSVLWPEGVVDRFPLINV